MKKTQWKDVLRGIRKNLICWIAIVTVTMVGCGVYSGVYFYADALRDQGVRFLRETAYEDLSILAPEGLTAETVEALNHIEGIRKAEGGYMLPDVRIRTGQTTEEITVCSLTSQVSVPFACEGRLPETATECALPEDWMQRHGLVPGDTVTLSLDAAGLPAMLRKETSLTITAAVRHGDCICTEYDNYIYLPASTFTALMRGRFNHVRITADIPETVDFFSDAYEARLIPIQNALEEKLPESCGILTRSAHEGYITYTTDVQIIRNLATIFVILFMLIGIVVVASTITILMDNNKKQTGTMLAYGFGKSELLQRYLVYGNSAVILGMLLSVALAAVLQRIIRIVIGSLFLVQSEHFAFYGKEFILLFMLELLMASMVTWIVNDRYISRSSVTELLSGIGKSVMHASQSEKPSSLPLYSRLILRNMRMDLPRVISSMVIIAGSCLLMGLGITLKDSLDDTMPRSASEIRHYDLEIMPGGSTPDTAPQLEKFLNEYASEFVWVHQKTTVYQSGETREYATILAGPDSVYPGYVDLRDRQGNSLTPQAGSTVITDCRMSERLGLQPGDSIRVSNDSFTQFPMEITGVCMNYYPRLICMHEETFHVLFGEDTDSGMALVRLGTMNTDDFLGALREQFPDATVRQTDRLPDAYEPMSRMFHVVVYILIALSIFMGVFVLLNLVHIFVNRRKKELIIMAVNGFQEKQQIRYLLRETIITTLTGITLGVLIGWVMTSPVVRTVEVGEMMFVRNINLRAWLIAAGLEALFALLINLMVFRKIRGFQLTELTR